MVNFAREAVRWQPFDHRVWIEKCPIDFLGGRAEHAVEPDGIGHWYLSFVGAARIWILLIHL
jgi:hypothetical protein